MKKIPLLLALLFAAAWSAQGQDWLEQYFDGADTSASNSVIVHFNPVENNTWHIGPPQKNIFDAAASPEHAIVTDTVGYYPVNDSSAFEYQLPQWWDWGILAAQWKQKLDFQSGMDGGLIEFSADSGLTWENAFDNPYVYNFYGYEDANVDYLQNGMKAFTGTDTTWRDIWLCFDLSWMGTLENGVLVRHRITSDDVHTHQEGWMIDNLIAHLTINHTVNETPKAKYMEINPNPTTGRVNIDTRKLNTFHVIEHIELMDASGNTVQEWGSSPTKYFVDIGNHPDGTYVLRVTTNKQTETFRVMLQH